MTVAFSLLFPTWVAVEVAGLPAYARFAATLIAVCAYCLHPRSRISWRLGWVDAVGLGLIAAHLISDWHNTGFGARPVIRTYAEWFLPYVAGRLALRGSEDVRSLVPAFSAVAVILAVAAAAESVLGFDVAAYVFGPPPPDSDRPELFRWGLRRAAGPTENPIYLGAMQVLLFPWTVYAAGRAVGGRANKAWLLAPLASAVGIFANLSRGPQAALVAAIVVTILVRRPRVWPVMLAGAAVAVFLRPQQALDGIHEWGGERRQNVGQTVDIGGESVPFSSALYRVYLFDVYRIAMARSGPFGFGTEAVSGFPVNVPVGPAEAATLRRLYAIDNAYILLLLRFGYVGLTCFVALGATAIWQYAAIGRPRDTPASLFDASVAGALAGTMLLLLTVWMPYDLGSGYLWTLGGAAGRTVRRLGDSSA